MTWGYIAIYAVIAMIMSVSASIVIFLMVFNRRVVPDVLMFLAVAGLGSLAFMLTTRDLSQSDMALVDMTANNWAGRLCNMFSLGICLVALVRTAVQGVVSRGAVIVVFAAIQYYFVCFLMPISFDRWFVFDHKLLYPLLAFAILLMPSKQSSRELGILFGRIATLPALMSLVMLVTNYNGAVLSSYESLLPFFEGRLFGATPHANALGSLCAMAALMIIAFPPRRRLEFWVLLAINLTALLLSQSKSSILSLMLGAAIVSMPRLGRVREVPAWIYLLVFTALAAAPAAMTLFDNASYNFWSGNKNIQSLSTFTGRLDTWHATLYLVKLNPIFGPGWNSYLVYMQSLFPSQVPNPHNVYLMTAVQAGAVGLASLAIFLIALLIVAVGLRGRDRLSALAFITLICVHGMAESFTFQGAFVAPTFWSLLMFLRLLGVMAAPEPSVASDEATDPKLLLIRNAGLAPR